MPSSCKCKHPAHNHVMIINDGKKVFICNVAGCPCLEYVPKNAPESK